MTRHSSDRIFLSDIQERIQRIRTYVESGREEFMVSKMKQDAVIRSFEVIGEATKNLSTALRQEHPQVPWRRIAGFRDVLIHSYFRVDLDQVWEVIEASLPELEQTVNSILADLPED